MRINKQGFVANALGEVRGRSDDQYVRLTNVAEGAWALFGLLLAALAVVWTVFMVYTFLTPSKTELQVYNDTCNLIVGKDPHFVARNYKGIGNPMVCNDIKTGTQTPL